MSDDTPLFDEPVIKAGPLLKWAGGKRQLLPELDKVFPRKCQTYFEPFVGGASVFFHLFNKRCFEQAVINDWNPEIVNLYEVVRDSPESLMAVIDDLEARGVDENSFKLVRSWNFEGIRGVEGFPASVPWAARTIYLNKTGFNGLYRQNKKGEFNVPWGKRDKVTFYTRENVLACEVALRDVRIQQGDFADCTKDAKPGDLVYMDPPYVPVSATSDFKSYTADGFTLEDQTRVRDEFARLASLGVHVVASNSDTSVVRELYAGFDIRSVQARRNINSKGGKRGPVGEVIVVSTAQDK